MEPTNGQCGVQPSAVLLVLTLLVTSAASALLCTAIMTQNWEFVSWDREVLQGIATTFPGKPLDWLLNGKVARVNLSGNIWDPTSLTVTRAPNARNASLFFVPMYGGLWALCTLLTEKETKALERLDFPQSSCINYLTPELMREEGARTDWQHRMQNLSISCALVCLIILGCSALVGAFGVLHHQISAVLVTGVMYLLAATFAFFTLAIIHFKRVQSQGHCPANQTTLGMKVDGVMMSVSTHRQHFILGNVSEFLKARESTTGLSLQLGWGGVGTCVFVSLLWILLSKIMRYNPLSTIVALMTVL